MMSLLQRTLPTPAANLNDSLLSRWMRHDASHPIDIFVGVGDENTAPPDRGLNSTGHEPPRGWGRTWWPHPAQPS